ncbi:MAG: epimerase [Hyphomonas sp.]|uniref:NAD-dependent epimerase/dehydratase family protein n=1 Tax=Hyphomonas sp. TaxID=87 RepID=UPI001D1C7927|nr:NAD-dependent epimerase/dehydratase family protein [Hyphomonas sp.]MBA4226655.1 epimerase [Hyphomonas sp.]
MTDRTAFITGGAGFIGSRLVAALRPHVSRIVVFDNLHPQVHGADAQPPSFGGETEFIRGDVTDAEALREAVCAAKPSLVFHLAAETGTGQSYDEPARYNNVNVMGTAWLIEALRVARKGGAPKCRVVLAGSRAVYGEGAYRTPEGDLVVGPVRTPEDLSAGRYLPVLQGRGALTPCPTPEALTPAPASVYASTKLMQEYLLEQCGAEGDYEVAILRFQNVYGPGQSLRNPYTGVLSIFSSQVLSGRALEIYEDGEIVRDFVFVDDVVSSLVAAGTAETPPSGPVNIGSGYPATIREVAETLLERLGATRSNYSVSGKFRPGDIRYAVADISRATSLLGWTPKVSLDEGLTSLADWAKETYAREGRL